MARITIREIVVGYLEEYGYDGLHNDFAECACEIGDFGLGCDGLSNNCIPGIKKPCDCGDNHCAWHMVSK